MKEGWDGSHKKSTHSAFNKHELRSVARYKALGLRKEGRKEGGGGGEGRVKLRRQKSKTRIPLDWQKVINDLFRTKGPL